MLEIRFGENGEILLSGRFDASQEQKAQAFLADVRESKIVNLKDLEYISSAGLGTLLDVQKRLRASGGGLKLVNANKHVRDVFRFSGFDKIFEIE